MEQKNLTIYHMSFQKLLELGWDDEMSRVVVLLNNSLFQRDNTTHCLL